MDIELRKSDRYFNYFKLPANFNGQYSKFWRRLKALSVSRPLWADTGTYIARVTAAADISII